MPDGPVVPPFVLAAVAQPGGGKLALVLGAGCSFESPTELPLSKRLSVDAHRKLVLDGTLQDGECADPEDLSCVADAVFAKLGSQRPLVEVLPRQRMRQARPNFGSLAAAAFLLEGVVAYLLTLNYDLSVQNALTQLGAEAEVEVLRGPEDHAQLGLANVIFLHRSVEADPDAWVMRTASLDQDWKDGWEEVIASVVLASPVVAFAGLGTPVGVLIETVERIGAVLPEAAQVVCVDPLSRQESAYAQRLGVGDERYVKLGWSAFMRRLADRLVAEHRASLADACDLLERNEGVDATGADGLCDRAEALGLLGLGQMRAEWLLSPRPYMPARQTNPAHIADLLLVVGTLERALGARAGLGDDGLVEFWVEQRRVAVVRLANGQGVRRWASLEEHVSSRGGRVDATFAVVSGVAGGKQHLTPPADLVHGDNLNESVIVGRRTFSVIEADDVRQNPQLARNLADV